MDPQGVRLEWRDIPVGVRRGIEAALGGEIVVAENQPGGFSPGLAARCRLTDGRRCFIKSVSSDRNPAAPHMHRREAAVTAMLPEHLGTPRLRHLIDDGTWVTLVFDEVDGVPPAQPWRMDELSRVF